MRIAHRLARWFAVALLTALAAGVQAQDKPPLKPEEIEALVAPIALYPDTLLSQVLMASTYPLEIVQARAGSRPTPRSPAMPPSRRWRRNPGTSASSRWSPSRRSCCR
jgi:hypothetical protein